MGASSLVRAALPSFDTVRSAHIPSDVTVFDRHGEAVAMVRIDYQERRGAWIPLEAVSPALKRAVLMSEDRRFYDHGGVDWLAFAAAGWNWIWGDGARGASTLSMQVAAMLDPSLQRPGGGRSVAQKMAQARVARQLEETWSKRQILEAYLNLVAFRGELRGVEALSRAMFGKHPHGLNLHESAVAAALLRGPNASAQRVEQRACALLREMTADEAACAGLYENVQRWLSAASRPAVDQPRLAPHFARAVIAAHGSGTEQSLQTTLDATVQRTALLSMKRHLAGMGHAQLTDAAVVVLENRTGHVLAYVGSSGSASSAREVDHARARRQAGSTLKPMLYALALELRYLTAASLLNDAPLDVATAGGMYVPENYDRRHAGLVSVRTALASSLNIPAVRTLMLIGPERFAERLRRLGLPVVHEGDHYGYSLSLGSADVDLLSLTNAYRILANGGRAGQPVMVPGPPEQHAAEEAGVYAFDPLASWIVGDMLADREARARTFGLESALVTRFWSAVKTGTSKDMRDNWTLGWSDKFTVGVWVGNSAGLSMRDVSGVSGAAPIWHDVMTSLHEGVPSRRPPPPNEILQHRVTFAGGIELPRDEYFLPGTTLTHVEPATVRHATPRRIDTPVSNTIIALDPDVPLENQRLALRAAPVSPGAESVQWRIGSNVIARGTRAYWSPVAGRHLLILEDSQGNKIDEVRIQVRNLPLLSARPPSAAKSAARGVDR